MDPHINAVVLTEILDGDVIFCVSHSGESKDVVIPVKKSKPPARIIALTGFPDSSLSKIADASIVTSSEEINYFTDAMVSRIVQTAVIDTLFVTVSLRKGYAIWERLKKSRQALSYLKF